MANALKNSQNIEIFMDICTTAYTILVYDINWVPSDLLLKIRSWNIVYMMWGSLIRYIYQRVLRSICAPLIAQVAITFLRVSLHSFNIFTIGVSIGFRVPNDFVLKIIVFYFFSSFHTDTLSIRTTHWNFRQLDRLDYLTNISSKVCARDQPDKSFVLLAAPINCQVPSGYIYQRYIM